MDSRALVAKPRLLVIARSQFGYHVDTYYYCRYLRDAFDVTYIGWDYGRPAVSVEGVRVINLSRAGHKALRYARFLKQVSREIRENYDLCFIKYFPGCSILRLLRPRQRFVFDIRTGRISYRGFERVVADRFLRLESRFFDNVTIISPLLATRLGFSNEDVHVIPLGADSIVASSKRFDGMHLLYVGTLNKRNLDQTIHAFARFYAQHRDTLAMSYKIIGSGYASEVDNLRKLVQHLGLSDVVEVLGLVPHDRLQPHFDSQNIGVAYIPQTPYFDCQPATKVFEYLLSGMPVIATRTAANEEVVHEHNGVLIEDHIDGFEQGLEQMRRRLGGLDSTRLRQSVENYTWSHIVRRNLQPYLSGLLT